MAGHTKRTTGPFAVLLKMSAGLPFLLIGCTLGPEPTRPPTAAEEVEQFANASTEQQPAAESVSPWWRSFGDEVTSELVELALENNTDLHVAAARVLEAEASLRRAGASQWPQIDYGGSASRQKNSFVLPQTGRVQIFSTTYSGNLGVSYQVDLFGKLKRTRQSAWASVLAETSARDAVLHAVVAGVVRARVLVATTQRAQGITNEIRTSWERTLDTVERRYRSGLIGPVDLYLARENLSSARAAEVQLEAQVRLAGHALDVLVGRRPGSEAVSPLTLAELPDLSPVPVGLPAQLLDRRPDLQEAEMRFAAATYGIGAALADLYPSLTLTGSIGTTSTTLSELTSVDAVVYNAVASLLGPLFRGGAVRAEIQAARARTEAAAWVYAGAVLRALREVEDALVNDLANQERYLHTQQRLDDARSADRLARERYQRGVAPLLTVLETERRLRNAEEALITSKADLWNTRINLFLSLGGDWTPSPQAGTASEASS